MSHEADTSNEWSRLLGYELAAEATAEEQLELQRQYVTELVRRLQRGRDRMTSFGAYLQDVVEMLRHVNEKAEERALATQEGINALGQAIRTNGGAEAGDRLNDLSASLQAHDIERKELTHVSDLVESLAQFFVAAGGAPGVLEMAGYLDALGDVMAAVELETDIDARDLDEDEAGDRLEFF